MSKQPKTIFIGMPTRPGSFAHTRASLAHNHASLGREHTIILSSAHTSLLPHTFNLLWVDALNKRKEHGITHFGMIHDDVCAEPGWVDVMLEEMERVNADIIAAVVPIKSKKGITSTGIDNPKCPWNTRRLTMTEVCKKSITFTHPRLLLNTGLWLCKMSPLFCDPPLFFRQQDRLVQDSESGKWFADTIPEDWDFSRRVRERKGRIFATRKVSLFHQEEEYENQTPWGIWKTDEAFLQNGYVIEKEEDSDECREPKVAGVDSEPVVNQNTAFAEVN